MSDRFVRYALLVTLVLSACVRPASVGSRDRPNAIARAEQLLVVTTSSWDATAGTLRRYARSTTSSPWQADGDAIAVVVGRTGLAWDDVVRDIADGEPRKREGDGKSPAGAFPMDTVFGFAPASDASSLRLPYVMLHSTHECVDDVSSAYYNTVVDRSRVPRVDWSSSEKMRSIPLYRLGVIVGYNAPPRAGRGSCIFLHIWDGPRSVTAGCTAMDAAALESVVAWLDRARHPAIVQLTDGAYHARRGEWGLP